MPRYGVTGAGLGRKGNYRTKAREADRWKIAPASLPFFCALSERASLSQIIFTKLPLCPPRGLSTAGRKSLLSGAAGAFGVRTAVFVKTAQKLSRETAFLMFD